MTYPVVLQEWAFSSWVTETDLITLHVTSDCPTSSHPEYIAREILDFSPSDPMVKSYIFYPCHIRIEHPNKDTHW